MMAMSMWLRRAGAVLVVLGFVVYAWFGAGVWPWYSQVTVVTGLTLLGWFLSRVREESDVQVGDTFLVGQSVFEVVDIHDGIYHLNNCALDAFFNREQLERLPRVRQP